MADQHLCAVTGCFATKRATEVSLHSLPKAFSVRQEWISFLGHSDVKKKPLVCSQHFSEDCFTNWNEKQLGFASKLVLKPDAVPSIRTRSDTLPAPLPPSNCAPPKQTRDVGCQWEPRRKGKTTVATQLSASTLKSIRSKAVQVHPSTRSVGTDPDWNAEFGSFPSEAPPLKRPCPEELLEESAELLEESEDAGDIEEWCIPVII